MTDKFYLFSIAGVVIVSLFYLLTEKLSLKILKIKADKVAFENAKIALERLSAWTTWLTGLQTAAMAAMALLVKGMKEPLTETQTKYGFFVLLILVHQLFFQLGCYPPFRQLKCDLKILVIQTSKTIYTE